jgi:hypothetical protein
MKICFEMAPFFIKTIENHTHLKPKILESIKEMGTHKINVPGENIFNSDWYLSRDFVRPYTDLVMPIMLNTVEEISVYFGYKQHLFLRNWWFQQYAVGDHHDWHIHEDTLFSSIYYVDLPNGTAKTTFRAAGKEFEMCAEEGDVLTFPSFFEHCSRPNKVGLKTVISFNM